MKRKRIQIIAGDIHSRNPSELGKRIKVIRFGTPILESFNRRDNVLEKGMSCYEFSADGKVDLVGWYFGFTPRPAWLGTGTLIGRGSDGEPIVSDFKGRRISQAMKETLLPKWADR